MSSPILLVGLPRSGSTLVSRILNDSLNCFVINDFYYLQYVESVDGYSQTAKSTKESLVDFIVDQVRNRTKPKELKDEVWFGLPFSEAELEKISDFANSYKSDGETKNWAQILQDMMQFLADLAGKPIWGYNTPQDYLNFNVISDAFPEAKFIFLLRSPVATLLSYKYYWTVAPKFQEDRGRYHPVIQSLAWKTCVNTYFDLKEKYGQTRCMLIKFEEVLNNTDQVLAEINQFSGIEFPQIDLTSFGHNSSLSKNTSDRQPKRITGLEAKICYLVTKQELYKLGYDDFSSQKIGLLDFFNLLMTTLRNSIYYFRQIIFSRNVRKRVFKFVNQVTLQTGQ
ncbi:sulfotransferase domain protein [Leptolyngbya sp. Heron Island J]|uniref:sulfotransferase family protein n=1 Tax=Leptolyngbya sp. Heron Island J TaxID=1385935 RepID=UPI0003B96B57|nr:sulfotransferase [Leptolyngbya sp. Heron Island J]ESA36474.1 sulfotransferase domain protein [Leptolyngbya sp. Heron Island J]